MVVWPFSSLRDIKIAGDAPGKSRLLIEVRRQLAYHQRAVAAGVNPGVGHADFDIGPG
jgi:hypothetical protein